MGAGSPVSRYRPAGVPRVVVLLGPPGSGKSTVGEQLGRRGVRWRDWESALLRRWGGRDAFVARKAEALPWLHDEIRRWIAADPVTAAIETTGLSDAAFLDRLDSELACFVVRLDVAEEVARRRVAQRAPGRHLTDEVDRSGRVWHAFYAAVAPARRVDLVVDTERRRPAGTADDILAACGLGSAGHA